MRKTAFVLMLIISLTAFFSGCGSSPQNIKGLWYDKAGIAGTLEFKEGGVVTLALSEKVYNGTYSFDSEKGEGKIKIDDTDAIESSFTLSEGKLIVDNGAVIYTKDKVNQKNIGGLLKSLGEAAGN